MYSIVINNCSSISSIKKNTCTPIVSLRPFEEQPPPLQFFQDLIDSFVNELSEEVIPPEFFGPIEDGAREALLTGVVAGYPMVDIKISLIGGGYREGVSTEVAYKIAASMAVKEGCEKAKPILLEPIMSIDVVVPEEFVGEVIGDLNARRGKLENITSKGKVSVIKALVPLKQMFGYSTSLRSASQGRGTFSMQFSHYDQAE